MTSEQRLCGIPSNNVGTCDKAWGHAGDIHANAGDGFYARKYDEEHRKRQAETGNLPKPTFHFSISAEVSLDIEDIWPDGDAPDNPTVDDVVKVVEKCGGKMRVIKDWDLDDDLSFDISDGKTARNIP